MNKKIIKSEEAILGKLYLVHKFHEDDSYRFDICLMETPMLAIDRAANGDVLFTSKDYTSSIFLLPETLIVEYTK